MSLQTAADNPAGAAQAVQLSMTSATLSQYATNQNAALASLQAEDQTLQNVSTVLTTRSRCSCAPATVRCPTATARRSPRSCRVTATS